MSHSRSSGHRFRALVSLLAGAALVVTSAGFIGAGSSTISGSPEPVPATTTVTVQPAGQPVVPAAEDKIVSEAPPASGLQAVVRQAFTANIRIVATASCSLPVYNGAGISVKTGPRLAAFESHVFFGNYTQCKNGVITTGWYCVQAGKLLDLYQAYSDVSAMTDQSVTVSQEVAYVLQGWGNTAVSSQAAAVSAAVRLLVNDPKIAPDWAAVYSKELPAAVVSLTNTMVAKAKAYHGNHKLNISGVPATAHAGQIVTATVSVTSKATGRTIPNAALAVSYAGFKAISVPKSTGSTGKAAIKLQVISLTGSALSVSNTMLQSVRLLQTIPSTTQQRLVKAFTTPTVKVGLVVRLTVVKPSTPSVTQTCLTSCAGTAPVTIKPACNAKGAATKQTVITVTNPDTKKVTTYSISLASGACGSKTLQVADRSNVCAHDRYYLNGAYTANVTPLRCVTVDCPPLPNVTGHVNLTLDFSCPCTGGEKVTGYRALLTVIASKNTSHGEQVLFVNDTVTHARVATVYWTPGQTPKPLALPIAKGQQLSVYAGTYPLHGSLKYKKYYTSSVLPTA